MTIQELKKKIVGIIDDAFYNGDTDSKKPFCMITIELSSKDELSIRVYAQAGGLSPNFKFRSECSSVDGILEKLNHEIEYVKKKFEDSKIIIE
jgi:hypothetical protein